MTVLSCCSTTAQEINLGAVVLGDVDRLSLTMYKDGALWLGIDSVVLTFRGPDDTEFTRNATLETPDAGVWYYDTVVTDFDAASDVGDWMIGVKITDGTIVKHYPYEITLTVKDLP